MDNTEQEDNKTQAFEPEKPEKTFGNPKSSSGSHRLLGQKLLEYRITGIMGEGGMGVVYKAHQQSLDRNVAIKLLPGAVNKNEQLKALIEEARMVAKMQHPHMVTVHQLGEDRGQFFVVMELCLGHTLECLIDAANNSKLKSRSHIPITKTISLVRQIAIALDYAHSKQIIHLDIKPANVMVDPENQVKVMDFGLAKFMSLTQSGPAKRIAGTPSYMSPEQTMGKDLDARSDMFSLGVLFYEALTGKKPFQGANVHALFSAIHSYVPRRPSAINSNVTADIDAIVFIMLEKHRDDRYKNMKALIKDLDCLSTNQRTDAFVKISGYHKSKVDRKSHTKLPQLKPRPTTWLKSLIKVSTIVLVVGGLVTGAYLGLSSHIKAFRQSNNKTEVVRDLEIAQNYVMINRGDLARPLLLKIIQQKPDSKAAVDAKVLLLRIENVNEES